MHLHPNELMICYDPQSIIGKQTLALARSQSNHVHEIKYEKHMFTSTIWKDILEMLHLRPKDLLNKANPTYQKKIRGNDFDDEGWLNVLMESPELIKCPIVVHRNKAVLCTKPSDITRI